MNMELAEMDEELACLNDRVEYLEKERKDMLIVLFGDGKKKEGLVDRIKALEEKLDGMMYKFEWHNHSRGDDY